ncbi:MAG TPA: ThiF family adenylyltransferase [Candidatus Methanomethylophilaceae archaeon]|nr:ThiF family adenylyltransferase [Candidatus Methanomethylophilaceae archaeon]
MSLDTSDTDRFDRMRRIPWMDMNRILDSRCLVVGAGALGNEVVKCMVLAGFSNVTVVDMDQVANSNLSRCVLFREGDDGSYKSEVVAERAMELSPRADVKASTSMIQDLDIWDYDVVFGCLDNISARLHTNSHSVYHRIPYVDGAMDGM